MDMSGKDPSIPVDFVDLIAGFFGANKAAHKIFPAAGECLFSCPKSGGKFDRANGPAENRSARSARGDGRRMGRDWGGI